VISETKTPNDIALKTTATGTDKVSLTVEPEYKLASHNLTVKSKIVTDRTLEGTVTVADLGTKGTKFELAGKRDAESKHSLATSLSFVNEFVNVKGTGNFPVYSKDSPSGNLDLVVQYPEQAFWGLNVKRGLKDTKFEWNSRLQLNDPENGYSISLLLDKKKDSSMDLTWSWFQKVNPSVKYSWAFVTNSKADTTPSCTVGAEYKVDPVSIVRGRLSVARPPNSDPNLRLALALNQTLSDHVTATIGADVNASSFLGLKGGADHSLGFEVKLK